MPAAFVSSLSIETFVKQFAPLSMQHWRISGTNMRQGDARFMRTPNCASVRILVHFAAFPVFYLMNWSLLSMPQHAELPLAESPGPGSLAAIQ